MLPGTRGGPAAALPQPVVDRAAATLATQQGAPSSGHSLDDAGALRPPPVEDVEDEVRHDSPPEPQSVTGESARRWSGTRAKPSSEYIPPLRDRSAARRGRCARGGPARGPPRLGWGLASAQGTRLPTPSAFARGAGACGAGKFHPLREPKRGRGWREGEMRGADHRRHQAGKASPPPAVIRGVQQLCHGPSRPRRHPLVRVITPTLSRFPAISPYLTPVSPRFPFSRVSLAFASSSRRHPRPRRPSRSALRARPCSARFFWTLARSPAPRRTSRACIHLAGTGRQGPGSGTGRGRLGSYQRAAIRRGGPGKAVRYCAARCGAALIYILNDKLYIALPASLARVAGGISSALGYIGCVSCFKGTRCAKGGSSALPSD